jgi:hypothetical protein
MQRFIGQEHVEHSDIISAGVRVPRLYVQPQYDIMDVLALATELADHYYFIEAYSAVQVAQHMAYDNESGSTVVNAVRTYVFLYEDRYNDKYQLYPAIEGRIASLIPGAVWMAPRSVQRKRPDVIIQVNGELAVGKVKTYMFTQQHLEQLQTYMRVFEVNHGYAFAKRISAELPDNVTFVSTEGLNDAWYQKDIFFEQP